MLQISSCHKYSQKRCLDHNDLNNYRLVSNLCFIAKILDLLVLSIVSSYLNSHKLYSTFQSAYRPGHNTKTSHLKVVYDLFLYLDKGNIDRPSFIAELSSVSEFSSVENANQFCDFLCTVRTDPIPSKLLIECLDCILPSLTDLFNSSVASGIFPQCFKSAHVTPILKKR